MNNEELDKFLLKYSYITVGNWSIDENGVYRTSDKGSVFASPIPIIPTAIIENIDSQVEKVELTFLKANRIRSVIIPRSVVASNNSIIKLSDMGIEVNSGNAKELVRYLSDIIADNLETLPRRSARSVMGWSEDEFMPYTDKIVFDGDEQYKYLYRCFAKKGSFDEWKTEFRTYRKKIHFRLCMAASFASPIIEVCGENPFVFHLWGGTGAGKTVALIAAMSIWGNPAVSKLVRTMNMTVNSMLSTSAFLNNIPFAGDELQSIKTSYGNYDKLIMQITEGVDRGRMKFDEVKETRSWKCSYLFSGEEPCIKSASGGGAKNRVIEIECVDSLFDNGNKAANFARNNYGHAGPIFIEYVKEHKEDIVDMYRLVFNSLMSIKKTTDKQAGSMALMATADKIASDLFWPGERSLTFEEIASYLAESSDVDVSERAYSYIMDWVSLNRTKFTVETYENWGSIEMDEEEEVYLINYSVLDDALNKAGYDTVAVLSKWAKTGKVKITKDNRTRWFKRINGMKTHVIKLSAGSY